MAPNAEWLYLKVFQTEMNYQDVSWTSVYQRSAPLSLTGVTCVNIHLEVIPDEAVLERCCCGVLDSEVPAAEDLKAHICAVTFPHHPGVLVANSGSGKGEKTWEKEK